MYRYPDKIRSFIEQNVRGKTTQELVKLVNAEFGPIFTESKMRSYKNNRKLRSGAPCGVPAGRPTGLYPAEIKAFIAENYNGVGAKAMTELLNITFGTKYTLQQIKSYYGNRRLNSGLTGYFPKGYIPKNKGRKGYFSPGAEKGWFRRGHTPHNSRSVGSEVIRAGGYVWVKIAEPGVWRQKHVLTWEDRNGAKPPGSAIIFGDGDNRNFDINNLICVTKAQLAILNRKRLIQKDADQTRSAIIVADIIAKINQRKKTNTTGQLEEGINSW